MGVKTCDLLDHMMDRYGNITAADLKSNEPRINKSFIIHVLLTSFSSSLMMPYQVDIGVRTHARTH